MSISSTNISKSTINDVQKNGYAILPSSILKQRLNFNKWADLCETWRRLPADPYAKQLGIDRRRTYSQLVYSAEDYTFTVSDTPVFFQSEGMNDAFGGLERDFERGELKLLEASQFHALIRSDFNCLPLTKKERMSDWYIDIHQITTYVESDSAEVTPEGIHQDGYQFMAQHFVHGHNIGIGGESRLYNAEKQLVSSVYLNHFMDTVLLYDAKMYHAVTPIGPKSLDEPAYRDMLLIGFRRANKADVN